MTRARHTGQEARVGDIAARAIQSSAKGGSSNWLALVDVDVVVVGDGDGKTFDFKALLSPTTTTTTLAIETTGKPSR